MTSRFLVRMLIIYATVKLVLLLAACGGGDSGKVSDVVKQNRPTPPVEFLGITNPKAGDAASALAGEATYAANCALCHGDRGEGDGPAGTSLDPAPGDLAEDQKYLGDDYLFWRISEGGMTDAFKSAMPSWKNSLNEDQIWGLITFLRTLGD